MLNRASSHSAHQTLKDHHDDTAAHWDSPIRLGPDTLRLQLPAHNARVDVNTLLADALFDSDGKLQLLMTRPARCVTSFAATLDVYRGSGRGFKPCRYAPDQVTQRQQEAGG
jgi:hypothetical protein